MKKVKDFLGNNVCICSRMMAKPGKKCKQYICIYKGDNCQEGFVVSAETLFKVIDRECHGKLTEREENNHKRTN